ncbi:MAG TPA: monovalent cation/H(+) antiporter subunit G [Desulfobacterales bacterium]|nr:monovalent cation/H(+) antiporter subunit G [Desulfobacterales bacterium]
MSWVVQAFYLLAVVFALIGDIGVLVFPDVYTRLQASSTCSTTSVFSVFIAAALASGFTAMTGKLVVIALFFLVSGPVAAHIVARYAWERGMVPWVQRAPRAAGEDG